jgi:MGT family glycosyltransferase
MNVLIVTWQGGGCVPPAIGLGRRLAARGHAVRVLGPVAFAGRVAAAGARHVVMPAALESDPARARQLEDQPGYMEGLLFGPGLADAVLAELEREPADAVVVDFLLRSVLCALESVDCLRVPLVHMAHQGGAPGEAEWGIGWQYARLNAARERLGLDALPSGPLTTTDALIARADRALVALPPEFDSWPDPPASVLHVGTIEEADAHWASPWPDGDRRPLIVVSLGTTYMHQEDLLARIGAALHARDARVLVTTGHELAPEEVAVDGAHVSAYAPHAAVLPGAALVIHHGGLGTTLAALAAGVPSVIFPLGRDQHDNAARAAEVGEATVLDSESAPEAIRAAVDAALQAPRRPVAFSSADPVAALEALPAQPKSARPYVRATS